jgi:hypothetical protein
LKKFISLLLAGVFTLTIYGQNIQTNTFETWTSGSWQNSMRWLYTYDGSGYLTTSLTQVYDIPTSSYKNYIQTNYTNNSNGTVQFYIIQNWDNPTNAWINSERSTYTYNDSKKPWTIIVEIWASANWQNSMKWLYTYDGNGYLTNNLSQSWDIPTSSYKNNSQTNYSNNSNGTVQHYIFQYWDNPTNAWINSRRITYTYNASNKPLTNIADTWTSGIWQNHVQQSYTYDVNEYLTTNLAQLWDIPTSSYLNYYQINYTNNSDGTIQHNILQTWDSQTNTWVNSQRLTYTYTSSTGIFKPGEFAFSIFPNPTTDKINISLIGIEQTKISIIDLQGITLFSNTFVDSKTILDVSRLISDIYLIVLERNNKRSVARFIKN